MSPERVLVVDDDDALLNLMGLALRRRGYQVELAEDGFHALKILSSQPPFSVLLTDLMMPGMNGVELLREAHKLDENIEVVVVTAVADLEMAISAMRADGAYDYLLKPFETMNQLLLAVERAAAQRRLLLEREELRIKVQKEAEHLRALIIHTGDAIFSANSDGILKTVNPTAARLIGVSTYQELEGTNALTSLPPALSILISNWQAVGGDVPAIVELPWNDGSIQMVSLAPIPEGNGVHWGWVAVLRDITHVKKMEELKSRLLVDVASRIRVPLVQAMNALVELNLLTSQNERVSEVVSRLSQTWKRIQEWGEDLNALIRIDSEINLQSTKINLGNVLNEVYQNQSASLLETTGIQLILGVEPELPQVIADPELIQRLINGLINRAVSRSERGGQIHLDVQYTNNQVWVSISDDGPAVEETDLPRIFEKSFVKTSSGPGITGLEMALVKTIIDRMGGQVWVGGQDKKGSSVYVCLPSAPQTSPA